MPPKSCVEQGGRTLSAISVLKGDEICGIKAIQTFNIPFSTLHDRLEGVSFKGDIRANSHKLTTSETESPKE